MLLKILIFLPILSIYVDSIALDHHHEPKHAVSTQSFHREDVPLSYKYSSVHIYTTPRPEQRHLYHESDNTKYNPIQYAPLEQNNYRSERHKYIPEVDDHSIPTIEEEHQQHDLASIRKDHLEPKFVTENLDAHNQNYRSYVPGHNIAVLQSNLIHGSEDHYRAHPFTKLQIPRVTQKKDFDEVKHPLNLKKYPKPEQETKLPTDNIKASEQRPLSEEHNILYTFLPKPLQQPQYAYGMETQQHQALFAKIPRLHLNIARVYGFAHMNHANNPYIGKPPSHTQAIFQPLNVPIQQKTILYPVQDTNKNYPIIRP